MCPSHFCRVRVTSPSSQSHLKFIRLESESSHKNCRVTSSYWFASSSHMKFHIFSMTFLAMKWCPTCYEMAPDKLEYGIQCCFSNFDCWLFIPEVIGVACFYSCSCSNKSGSCSRVHCKFTLQLLFTLRKLESRVYFAT